MVYRKPNPTSGAMKRSASALEGPPGWDVAPPMMAPQSSCHIPFAHYALIYVDSTGKLGCEESASIMDQNITLFTPDVRQAFLETLGEKIGFHQPLPGASPRRVRRRRNAPTSMTNSHLADDSDSDDYSPVGNETTSIRIGDSAKVMHYYQSALKHFQQLNCRMVAKAFIKFIEPRKQVRHPYNGGKPPAGSAPGTTGDPEKTKPEWWPPGVMHKEPDHLRKEYRVELLLHIIRKLGGYGITADKLKEVACDTKRSLKHPSHVDIILEVLRVRKMEEKWERGEIDASTLVYVMNRGPSPKGDEEEDSNDGPTVALDVEHIEDGLLTPSSSVEQTAPLTTPMDAMGLPPRSMPGNFPLAEPLTFESRDRPYYATPPQYTDSFSQGMMNTPVTAEMISPHDVSVFAYPSHPSYPSSTSDQHWSTPTFRQDIFSPVSYNSPATTQPLTQASMPYNMAMAPPMHGLPPHEQSAMDPVSRSLPFRTGSLGHPHPHGSPLAHLS